MTAGVVIVGAGECGARTAFALREKGFDGPIALIGNEPHLPYERPPLSKGAMAGDDAPSPKSVATKERFAAAGIELVSGTHVTSIDRKAKTIQFEDGATRSYDKLLLATGASPRRLVLAGVNPDRLLHLRSFHDALRIRRYIDSGSRIAIIGGGFIGMELAAGAAKRGAKAIVIEAQPRILMRGVPEEIAALIHSRHSAEGVEILCGDAITQVKETADGLSIELASGRDLTVDCIIAGIGAMPETGLAAAAGLAVENGIAVDAFLRTNDPDIFAAGDCCSFPHPIYDGRRIRLEAWRNAHDHAELAATNILGGEETVTALPWFWSDQYDLTLQIAGLADGAAQTVRRDLGGGAFILFYLAEDGRLLAASGIGTGNVVAKDIRLAEMLIARRAAPDAASLASADVKLKTLLAA